MTTPTICTDVFGTEYAVAASELTQRIGVYLVIIEDNKILLTRQWNGYSLIGGGVDKGETLEQAAVREAKEETGLDITPGKLIHHAVTYFKKDADAQAYQSFQFYFAHESLTGRLSNASVTDSEKGYTQDIPAWVPLDDLATIDFRHSVDLPVILAAHRQAA